MCARVAIIEDMEPQTPSKPTGTLERLVGNPIPVWCSFSEIVPLGELRPNPRNPNKHSSPQIELYARIIEAQGFRRPITVSRQSGHIVRGHGAMEASIALKLREVPVDYQDYESPASEMADLLADNYLAKMAKIDKVALVDAYQQIDPEEFDVSLTAVDPEDIDKIAANQHTQGEFEIVPQLNESYDYVLVFTDNETDFLFLSNLVGLKKMKSYKNTGIGLAKVVPFRKFMEALAKNKDSIQKPEPVE